MSLKYIILFLAIIIVVVVIISYPRIKLFFIKLFYSKYHYRYINAYKKYTKKSPHGYCIKDEFIYHILVFKEKDKRFEKYTTVREIKFGDTEYFTTYQEIKRQKRKPFCFNSYYLNNKYDIKIIGYRDSMFNTTMRVLYYFIDDVFFMGEYIFKDTLGERAKRISKIMHEKYLGHTTNKSEKFYIDGPYDTSIHFADTGFSLIIKYFSNEDNDIKAKLDDICKEYKGIEKRFDKRKHKDELYDRL